MRIMLQPVLGIGDVSRDSNGLTYLEIARHLSELYDKKCWFYLVVSRDVAGTDKFEELGNVTVLKERRRLEQYFTEVDVVSVDVARWFAVSGGRFLIDVVLTSKTGGALMLKKMLSDFRLLREEIGENRGFPVVIYEDRAFGRSNTHNLRDAYEFMMRAMSYASMPSFFMTPFEIEEALDASKEFVSPTVLKKIKENAVLLPNGVDVDEIDRLIEGVKKNERFTVFWGGRFAAQKKIGFIMDVFNRFYESGVDADMVLTSPHLVAGLKIYESIVTKKKRNSRIRVIEGVPREDFIRMCAASHAWISGSLYEGFTMAHAEMAYVGVPGIVPRRPWSEYMFGKDYPLMYDSNNLEQAVAMLRWVYENPKEAEEIGAKTRENIRSRFTIDRFIRGLASLLESEYRRAVEEMRPFFGGKTFKTVETVADKMGDEFVFDDFVKEYEVWGKVRDKTIKSMPNRWHLYQMLKEIGYEDLYTASHPVMRRMKGKEAIGR